MLIRMATKEISQSRNIKLPDSLWRKLKEQAKERECTVGSIIRYALKQYIQGARK